MGIEKKFYGNTTKGAAVDIFTLRNSKGMMVEITNYGGIITSINVSDNKGNFDDVVLGFDKLEGYMNNKPYFGAVIGRVANRIENSKFEINGIEYKVAPNDGANHLHGGIVGFDKVIWRAEIDNKDGVESLALSYVSQDGEEGYPGKLYVRVTYTLTEENALNIDYYGVSDKDTVVNLTNHSYFNLGGHDSGDILKHKVMINSEKFTVSNKDCVPTGEIKSVENTPLDFRELTEIGRGINSEYDQLVYGMGYDHNFILKVNEKNVIKAAEVYEENSGRVMEVYTNKPGIQLYSGNHLDGTLIGKGGKAYEKRNALCLETQFYPNSIKHKHFPSPILKACEEYNFTTIYKFSTR
jgi:aldose 1-epimerase